MCVFVCFENFLFHILKLRPTGAKSEQLQFQKQHKQQQELFSLVGPEKSSAQVERFGTETCHYLTDGVALTLIITHYSSSLLNLNSSSTDTGHIEDWDWVSADSDTHDIRSVARVRKSEQ